jgi:flavin reductase (DIM6/NTAB) family NADH-FMN oxidoreductase RutF
VDGCPSPSVVSVGHTPESFTLNQNFLVNWRQPDFILFCVFWHKSGYILPSQTTTRRFLAVTRKLDHLAVGPPCTLPLPRGEGKQPEWRNQFRLLLSKQVASSRRNWKSRRRKNDSGNAPNWQPLNLIRFLEIIGCNLRYQMNIPPSNKAIKRNYSKQPILSPAEFVTIEPKILYFGTPVALVSSLNEDGSPNLAPMSSFWALGWTVLLGLVATGKTCENLARHPECVINLPAPEQWEAVERLAPLTGKNPVPPQKQKQFRYEHDKFGAAGFTAIPSEKVKAPRIQECPVQLEGRVHKMFELKGEPRLDESGGGMTAIVHICRVHIAKELLLDERHVDPARWQPLIYNFRHYFGLGTEFGKTFRAEK